jgi:hypothetical protein
MLGAQLFDMAARIASISDRSSSSTVPASVGRGRRRRATIRAVLPTVTPQLVANNGLIALRAAIADPDR